MPNIRSRRNVGCLASLFPDRFVHDFEFVMVIIACTLGDRNDRPP